MPAVRAHSHFGAALRFRSPLGKGGFPGDSLCQSVAELPICLLFIFLEDVSFGDACH